LEWDLGVGVEKAKKSSKQNGKKSKRRMDGERTSKNNEEELAITLKSSTHF